MQSERLASVIFLSRGSNIPTAVASMGPERAARGGPR